MSLFTRHRFRTLTASVTVGAALTAAARAMPDVPQTLPQQKNSPQ